MNLRETILAQKLPAPTLVPTPEWEGTDGQIFARALTAKERLATIDGFSDDPTLVETGPKWIILGACDASGSRIFTDADTDRIGDMDSLVYERLMTAIQKKAGVIKEEQDAIAKNSEEVPPDDSPSS